LGYTVLMVAVGRGLEKVLMRNWVGIGAVFGCLVIALGSAHAQDVSATDLEQGKALYDQHCLGCHGATGRGDGEMAGWLEPPPANLTRPHALEGLGIDGFMRVLRKGGRHVGDKSAMPKFDGRLDDEQVKKVWIYLVHISMRGSSAERKCLPAELYPRDENGVASELHCEVAVSKAAEILADPKKVVHVRRIDRDGSERVVVTLGGPRGAGWLDVLGIPLSSCDPLVHRTTCEE